MALRPQLEKLLAEAPPLTARQRDLIAACFADVDWSERKNQGEAYRYQPGSPCPT